MENQIGETVKFTKDLHCKYSINEIENLTVYNPLLKEFQKSEDWGSDNKVDCLFIGGFNANIDDKALFYFGHPIDYGFFPNDPSKLLFIPPGHTIRNFEKIGSMTFEKEFKKPSTMWDLGMHIDSYIFYLKVEMQNLIWTHQQKMSESKISPVMRGLGLIKVCPDPGCEAVWHNCPKKHTKCNDCGGNIMQINEDTFWKKFSNNWFQYDFLTGEYYRPQKKEKQLSLYLA